MHAPDGEFDSEVESEGEDTQDQTGVNDTDGNGSILLQLPADGSFSQGVTDQLRAHPGIMELVNEMASDRVPEPHQPSGNSPLQVANT